ncbi:MAG: hypothetical protein EP344_19900 [Bacteroidetes bacterium]|nr:MAG: hypothetical protein EP344_19900 [Bacteroidota bacterium]
MNNNSLGITLVLFMGSFLSAHTQTELATIALHPSLEDVRVMRHFHDDRGNTLFDFMGDTISQFSLVKGDSLVSSKTVGLPHRASAGADFLQKHFPLLPDRHQFLNAVYDEGHVSLFYRNNAEKDVYLYYSDMQTLPDHLIKLDVRQGKERALADVYHQGDFLVFNFSRKPFTFHTYRCHGDQAYEKKEQVLENRNNWQFLGRIQTDAEIIFVRLQMKDLTLHFYRYFKDRGFEKVAVPLVPLYKAKGLNARRGINITYANYFNADNRLDAFVEGDDIYLELTKFLPFGPGPGTGNKANLSAGILHLNWTTEKSQLLSFDAPEDKWFLRRFDLLGSRYYKLLVNRSKLELSIYDVESQDLLKKYAYTADQNIDLIYGVAEQSKRLHGNMNWGGGFSTPVSMGYRNIKGLDTRALLDNLSAGSLSFQARNSGDKIRLDVSGTDYKGVFVNKSETARFVGFLNASDLEIMDEQAEPVDPVFATIEDYIAQLEENARLGAYEIYFHQGKPHLAYIDKHLNCCKIIVFDK